MAIRTRYAHRFISASGSRPRPGRGSARKSPGLIGVGIADRAIGGVDVGADRVRRRRSETWPLVDQRGEQGVGRHHRLHAAGIIGEARADRLAGDRVDDREGVRPAHLARRRRRRRARGRVSRSVAAAATAPARSRAMRRWKARLSRSNRWASAGRHHPRGGGEHDHVLVIVGRHAGRDRPARIGDRGRPEARIVGDLAVAAVAVEEIEFGEDALGAARRAREQARASARAPSPGRSPTSATESIRPLRLR